jgi:hypothetical protein
VVGVAEFDGVLLDVEVRDGEQLALSDGLLPMRPSGHAGTPTPDKRPSLNAVALIMSAPTYGVIVAVCEHSDESASTAYIAYTSALVDDAESLETPHANAK